MDGEEEFFSGARSDDGGGTPVQDELAPESLDEDDVNSVVRRFEDEDCEAEEEAHDNQFNDEHIMQNEYDLGQGDSDSENGLHDSHLEQGVSRPTASDRNEVDLLKTRGSSEHNESKQHVNDNDAEEQMSVQRGQSGDTDSETEARKQNIEIGSDDRMVGRGKGKRKAIIESDSEDDEILKQPTGRNQKENNELEQLEESDDRKEKPVKRKKAILSDSEDEEHEKKPMEKESLLLDGEISASDGGLQSSEKSMAAKLQELGSDSEEDEDGKRTEFGKKDQKNLFGSDSDSVDEEEKMIADIFGESGDEEEEEFTGFNQEDLEEEKSQSGVSSEKAAVEDSDSDGAMGGGDKDASFVSDFDMMLARKKAQSGKRRRNRDGGTFISDADDVVSAMITKMTEAAEEDRTLNSQKKPALKKLTLLPTVVMHLKKQDLKETFIDSGVMTAIKEWISPLPDKSLPALKIREELLKILQELPSVSQETLKHSGIGRAVMFLYKHPKESRPNKDLALKLINEWSRPIFGLTSNYKGMTREERQQRDLDQQMPPRRHLGSGGQTPRRDLEKVLTGEEKALRPGDPGFCARARVPMPSNKDYVVRPKWNVDVEANRGPMKRGLSRVDKQMRRFADIKRLTKTGHAVKISVEGNRMPL
ncbi:protein IWS1 homolog A isoform X3 [Brienomyrus brachyistius]|uniref:protein IWS1 homolog A isoform X3 n=1 Tax=Brienomyrus brachyistius TaxID=42636 RepID=UPI0020B28762|nr:protein IWS1 homolog A isoform X3 [Brienomyrus brachyistius]